MNTNTILTGFSSYRKRLLLSFSVAMLLCTNIFAQVNVLIDPSATTVNVGQSFTVKVRVDITSGSISAAKATVFFDKEAVNVTGITKSAIGILPTEGPYSVNPSSYATINTNGYIRYAAGTTSDFPTEDFDFLTITFTALQGGMVPITLGTTFPFETDMSSNGNPVLGTLTNGTVNIISCTASTATISNTPTCNGQPFNLVLASATGTGPFDLEINGETYEDIAVGGIITTITPPTESVFSANPIPASTYLAQSGGGEVGNKFRASVPGYVKGVRFYRPNVAGGTYTGKLYLKAAGSETGTLVASATFPTTTGGQWQQVLFASPVLVAPNQTFVVTYYSPEGNYATTDGYFASSGVTAGSLTALENGVDGPNGMYREGAQGYPNQTYMSANYFVDVLFTPSSFTYNLTRVENDGGCPNIGALQTLQVNSVDCAALPVTFLNFSATPQGNNIILKWATASEFDNKGFEIQRSVSGGGWENIGFVNGAGNSSTLLNYTYTDANLFPRRYNYRLKQVDIDGRYDYSVIVSAAIDGRAEYSLSQNYPNPFQVTTTIQYTLPEVSKVNLTVYDMNGKVVKVLVNEKREAGTHTENFHTGSLPSGMYYYKIQAGTFSAAKKLVLQ